MGGYAWARTVSIFVICPCAVIVVMVLVIKGRKRMTPFLLGMIVGACCMALLEGICFGALSGI
ncbi:MAG TPA: hypothetical protein VHX86_13450 [Tepidisphaeraceae bacterium]|nr:hypothetical protein [Tepidisphaeraceae bacterium]